MLQGRWSEVARCGECTMCIATCTTVFCMCFDGCLFFCLRTVCCCALLVLLVFCCVAICTIGYVFLSLYACLYSLYFCGVVCVYFCLFIVCVLFRYCLQGKT
ncbi:hypothetical protein BKA80DRAFT_134323 [Phyllosticta citrichinensis]